MLTVNNGTGSGVYELGSRVLITANIPPAGQRFFAWTADTAILANPFLATTSALMPSMDVEVTAINGPEAASTLKVNNGTGGGTYPAGTIVTVNANTPPAGKQFVGWTGDIAILAQPSASSTTATIPSIDVEITANYSGETMGTGLRGQYYNSGGGAAYPLADAATGTLALTRTDARVDFDWGGGSPGSSVTADNFSAEWTGRVKAPVSGTYTFTVTGDDGVRLFLNGAKVIDGWRDQGPTPYTYTATLSAGTLYDIELQFYERGGGSMCRLQWSYPGQGTQAISQSQLHSN